MPCHVHCILVEPPGGGEGGIMEGGGFWQL